MRHDSSGPPWKLLLLGLDLRESQSYAIAPVVARMCADAGWLFDLVPVQTGLGQHFGGGRANAANAMGSSFIGGGHADQMRFLLERFNTTAVGEFSRANAELLSHVRPQHIPSNCVIDIVLSVARILDADLPQRLFVLDASAQGMHGINTAAYQYPSLLRSAAIATDIRDYETLRSKFLRLGITEHESLFVSRARTKHTSAPSGPQLGRQTYAEFTSSVALQHKDWAQGLLLGDPMLTLSSIPRAADLRLVPVYGRPQTEALLAMGRSPSWSVHGAWGRQFDDRDFQTLSDLSVQFQLIDVGPPLHTISIAHSADVRPSHDTATVWESTVRESTVRESVVSRRPNPGGVTDSHLYDWANEGRVLTSLVFWCGMVREVEAVERIADLVAMTGLKAGIALTTTAVRHLSRPLPPILLSCDDAGGRLEALLASSGDGIMFEHGLAGPEFSTHIAEMRAQLQKLSGQTVRGWWPLLDGRPREIPRRAKLRENRLVPPRQFAGRLDEDRPTLEARLMRLLFRFRVMQARPAEWVRPDPPSPSLLEAVRSAGFDYVVSKSARPERRVDSIHPIVLPAAAEWGGWTPFRTVATAKEYSRVERRVRRRQRADVIVANIDTALALQSGEAWRRAPQVRELAQLVADGGETGQLINVSPEDLARYLALLEDRFTGFGETTDV